VAGRLDICEHARAWASAAADGELNELEAASLEAHVAACPSCASFAREVDWLVRELRTAPLVEPALPGVAPRAPSRRRPVLALQLSGAAAAVAAAVALGHFAATLRAPHRAAPQVVAARTAATPETPAEQALVAMVARQGPHGRTIPT
jgi:ferric-dicitrate binding protein FerR (iron transport regulator)